MFKGAHQPTEAFGRRPVNLHNWSFAQKVLTSVGLWVYNVGIWVGSCLATSYLPIEHMIPTFLGKDVS